MSAIVERVQGFLLRAGLGDPRVRMAVGAGVGLLGGYLLKPDLFFASDGSVRPWKFTSPDNPDATPIPYATLAVVGAVAFGMLI